MTNFIKRHTITDSLLSENINLGIFFLVQQKHFLKELQNRTFLQKSNKILRKLFAFHMQM